MSDLTLVIGNKNYSSWSLRGWLALALTGAEFDEILIPLDLPETEEQIRAYSASGRVPCLLHGDLVIWDSLAIGEYLAELFPDAGLWPQERSARARARAVTAEMHAGFAALREAWPMDLRRRTEFEDPGGAVAADCARILEIWRDCRAEAAGQGDFLFGAPGITDAFFAPVAGRFLTYGLPLDPAARDYIAALWSLPQMQAWLAAAESEPWVLENP